MKVFLVRHGETAWIAKGKIQGWSDVPLNKRGRLQARKVAHFLKRHRPAMIFTSALSRSKETAGIISRACVAPVTIDSRLNELFFGLWEGKTAEEISFRYPKKFFRWWRPDDRFRPPKGESFHEMKRRILSFLKELGSIRERCVVVVTHGGPIRLILLKILGKRLRHFRYVEQSPCAVNIIEISNGASRVTRVNETGHLAQ